MQTKSKKTTVVKKKKEKEDKPEPTVVDINTFFEQKRATEIGNTYYLKAKEAQEQEELEIKQTFLNPQQMAVYDAKH